MQEMLVKSETIWPKMSLLLLFVLACLNTINCNIGGYVPYDYCDPNLKLCPVPRSHTMCRYPVPGLSKDCAPFINEPLTSAEKLHVLSLHNKLRSRVASGEEKTSLGTLPSASNMLQLYWDDELEAIADRWASRCFNVTVTKVHDDCRNTKRFRVTQNVGTIGSKSITGDRKVIQIFYHWYIKSKSFNPGMVHAYVDDANKTTEEFVNLIWADTYALGCANVIFRKNLTDSKDGEKTTPWTFERIICNYGPGGIIPGSPVYRTGVPCSQCPTGWSCSNEYNGLCSLNAKKTTKKSSDIASRIDFKGASSTFKYPDNASESSPTETGLQEWTFSPVDYETEKYNFKLKVGVYYNGLCHCPDVTRYGFEGIRKNPTNLTLKLEKLKSLMIRSVANGIPETNAGNMLGLKNGDRCYCKMLTPNASDRYTPSIPCLIIFFLTKLLIHQLQ